MNRKSNNVNPGLIALVIILALVVILLFSLIIFKTVIPRIIGVAEKTETEITVLESVSVGEVDMITDVPTESTDLYDSNKPGEKETVPSVENAVDWESKAIDTIYNYVDDSTTFLSNDGFFFYLVDLNCDGVPEIFEGAAGGTSGDIYISSFYYWDGNDYSEGKIDTEFEQVYYFLPYKSSENSDIVFWDYVIPEDYYNDRSFDYGRYSHSHRISLDNGRLYYSETIDRSETTDVLVDPDQYSLEFQCGSNESFSFYAKDFAQKYKKAEDVNNVVYIYWGLVHLDDTLYNKLITREEAERIVEGYKINDSKGHLE